MNLEKYIHSLLLENETVIVPGFGAFVSNYKPAEISKNEIKPPSKEISFTQQIRNNDGLLVGYIADEEGISHFDALKKIEKERENLIYKLDKGEKTIIEDAGELFYNEKNEIQFTPFHDDNLLLDSFGLETISIKNKVEKTSAEENAENKVSEKEAEDIKIIPEVKDAVEPEHETTIEENIEIKQE